MTVYPDTSVLISLLAEDRHSERAERWLLEKPVLLISTWTLAEVSAVLALKARQGVLTAAELARAERQVQVMTSAARSVVPTMSVDIVDARTLVRSSRNLRAPDALHLAIAMRLALPMATFDDPLLEAAAGAGHPVVGL